MRYEKENRATWSTKFKMTSEYRLKVFFSFTAIQIKIKLKFKSYIQALDAESTLTRVLLYFRYASRFRIRMNMCVNRLFGARHVKEPHWMCHTTPSQQILFKILWAANNSSENIGNECKIHDTNCIHVVYWLSSST